VGNEFNRTRSAARFLFPTKSEAACPGETLVSFTTAGRTSSRRAALALLALLAAFSADARAVTINWTTVGDPGNAADTTVMALDFTTGYGAVPYTYNMDKYEVTISQYAGFLNGVGATDTYSLYNSTMANPGFGGITRSGSSGSYSYSVRTGYGNLPETYVSWGDAARFANWLSNGQPTGAQNASSTEDGSYFLNGAITDAALTAVTRSAGATIVIASEDEWYKAAYYNPATSSYFQYPTGSNTLPSNAFLDAGNNVNFNNNSLNPPLFTDVGHFATSASPSGTFDQGGNVWEWTEGLVIDSVRVMRGGAFVSPSVDISSSRRLYIRPSNEGAVAGFRVASLSVPEPSSGVLAILACGIVWWWRKRFK
jgi:sulfatase modifying factor 1